MRLYIYMYVYRYIIARHTVPRHAMAWHASLHAQHAGAREGKLRGGSPASSVALFAAVAAFILGVAVALFLAPRV